jgi:hypothetical protein
MHHQYDMPRRARPRSTYKRIITERLTTYPELSAVCLFDEVKTAGYPGVITQVRDYVARVRPRPEPEPVLRFETPPGHQAQVDFAEPVSLGEALRGSGARTSARCTKSWSSRMGRACLSQEGVQPQNPGA